MQRVGGTDMKEHGLIYIAATNLADNPLIRFDAAIVTITVKQLLPLILMRKHQQSTLTESFRPALFLMFGNSESGSSVAEQKNRIH